MSVFNISGCCSLRDIFGFRSNNTHEVKYYTQFTSPVTWFEYNTKPPINIMESQTKELSVDFEWKNNFTKRCILLDYNRNVLDFYKEKGEYFLLDFTEMVKYGLVKQTFEDGCEHFFTATECIKNKNAKGISFLDLLGGKLEFISAENYLTEEFIGKIIDDYHRWLIDEQGYEEDEIICIGIFNATDIVNNGHYSKYYNYSKLIVENKILELVYRKFRERFAGSYYIEMPHNTYAIWPHKWGMHPLHFCYEVYDYMYECVDLITKGLYAQNDNYLLKSYEKILDLKREQISILQVEQLLVTEYHFSKLGWLDATKYEKVYREGMRETLEAFRTSVVSEIPGDINYCVHIKGRNEWTDVYSNGQMVGTTGMGLPVDGICIWLSGKLSERYSVYYEIKSSDNSKRGNDGEKVIITPGEAIDYIYIELVKKTI